MRVALLVLLLVAACPVRAACTVSSDAADLGSQTSFEVELAPTPATQTASGLHCDPALIGVATPAHIKAQVAAGLPGGAGLLTGPDGITVPFRVATTPNGTPLANGNEVVFVSQSALIGGLLGLFAGPGSSIPLYVDAGPASALKAGVYSGTVAVRWYYYTCSGIGALGICLGQSSSPGFGVNLLGQVTNWGSGSPAVIQVTLTVTADCAIDAPDVDFGSAPLVMAFSPVTQTLHVRCTRDQPYVVGLGDGTHALGNQRRLQNGVNHLRYELVAASTNARWGSVGAERRGSGDADVNGGVLDGVSTQGFVYRADILPTQPTPPAGLYTDDVQVLVEF